LHDHFFFYICTWKEKPREVSGALIYEDHDLGIDLFHIAITRDRYIQQGTGKITPWHGVGH
jgi:hypothetical protein